VALHVGNDWVQPASETVVEVERQVAGERLVRARIAPASMVVFSQDSFAKSSDNVMSAGARGSLGQGEEVLRAKA